uniref:uncharacterized protein LOC129518060 n=1 Tax=Nyctereutes procyonoides TaxID=34880 RepID=UPI00244500A6|nr:uncharacterized protein LOC129518060 [Nyctereutes procyonoides]
MSTVDAQSFGPLLSGSKSPAERAEKHSTHRARRASPDRPRRPARSGGEGPGGGAARAPIWKCQLRCAAGPQPRRKRKSLRLPQAHPPARPSPGGAPSRGTREEIEAQRRKVPPWVREHERLLTLGNEQEGSGVEIPWFLIRERKCVLPWPLQGMTGALTWPLQTAFCETAFAGDAHPYLLLYHTGLICMVLERAAFLNGHNCYETTLFHSSFPHKALFQNTLPSLVASLIPAYIFLQLMSDKSFECAKCFLPGPCLIQAGQGATLDLGPR